VNLAHNLLALIWSIVARPPRSRETQLATRTRRSARGTVVWFVAATAAISGATLLASDVFAPIIRDPEYGRRAASLRDRVVEFPDRPLVMFVGSSRVGSAIAPAEWEAMRTDASAPFLFNMGRAGAGPIIQLMTLRRTYADGFHPSLVLLEYWPPLMCQPKGGTDFRRIAPDQMLLTDLPLVREYAQDGGKFEFAMWQNRMNPIWGLRRTYMQQIAPDWLPWFKRMEILYTFLDPWGWLPGPDVPVDGCEERTRKVAAWAETFRPQFSSFEISPAPDRALRETVALAREHGAEVGLVYLPESSQFRGWYPEKAEKVASEYLRTVSEELHVPVINARTWLPDGYFADGFHLSKLGGIEFSRKLQPAVRVAFPEVRK
jgi:hypothetical protein